MGDTAQVGAEIAEFLDIPHVTNVSSVLKVSDSSITVEMDLPYSVETVEIQFPCLITVEKDIFQPRLPSYLKKKETVVKIIKSFSLRDLDDTDPGRYGLNGSPTQVERIFPPESHNDHVLWTGDARMLSEQLYEKLRVEKMLK